MIFTVCLRIASFRYLIWIATHPYSRKGNDRHNLYLAKGLELIRSLLHLGRETNPPYKQAKYNLRAHCTNYNV